MKQSIRSLHSLSYFVIEIAFILSRNITGAFDSIPRKIILLTIKLKI